ncbi:MAG: transcriptional regulator [Parvularculaceae bacterium]|nr:transcriptional regulator [Parvularculaceae bacterium]
MAKVDFDYQRLDDTIHGRVRLSVMAYLSGAGEADFVELRTKVGGTDGNLLIHLRKLEEAGYIISEKFKHHGAKPRTVMRLTPAGRAAWLRYIKRLEQLIDPSEC